jgi:hypothetical protein
MFSDEHEKAGLMILGLTLPKQSFHGTAARHREPTTQTSQKSRHQRDEH